MGLGPAAFRCLKAARSHRRVLARCRTWMASRRNRAGPSAAASRPAFVMHSQLGSLAPSASCRHRSPRASRRVHSCGATRTIAHTMRPGSAGQRIIRNEEAVELFVSWAEAGMVPQVTEQSCQARLRHRQFFRGECRPFLPRGTLRVRSTGASPSRCCGRRS